jgi:hypothetical protein
MTHNRISTLVIRAIEKQSVSDVDVGLLRNALEEGGCITADEAEALLRIERLVGDACDAWGPFFIDTITAHVVWECRPTGRVTKDQADWVIGQIDQPRSAPNRLVSVLLASLVSEAVEVDERLLMRALSENRFGGGATPAAEALKAA